MSKSQFCIDSGYTHREGPVANYLDDPTASSRYQIQVYEHAKKIYKQGHVLDIGCGVGDKLCAHFPPETTLGLDLEPTLSAVRQRHPDREWRICDFNSPPSEHFSLVISADVIEHILNPDDYLDFVRQLNFDVFVISTPDRSTLKEGKLGPPVNPTHYREWNFEEFEKYISQSYTVLEHFHCQEPSYLSQVIVFTK